jgi:repressor LexA
MQTLTDKQREILEVVRQGMEARGHAPTVREIGAVVGLRSSCTVKKHLDSLIVKGFLMRDRYQRGISLMEDGMPITLGRSVCVPLLGRVAGGPPILAEESPTPEMLPVPTALLRRGETAKNFFALEVYGDSMQGIGIGDGDIVVARRQLTAEDGDIVVALLGDEATVKRFYKESDRIRLQPENPDYSPIFAQDVQIMGKVAMTIKWFS